MSKKKNSGLIDTLIQGLSHWIPLLTLIVVVPIIFNPFFSGPKPIPDTLICNLSHCIPVFTLITVVPITYKPFFFCCPTHPS